VPEASGTRCASAPPAWWVAALTRRGYPLLGREEAEMAGIVPGPLITAPEPLGRRYGLLAGAAGPIDLPPHGAGGGVRYVPVTCGEAHSWPIECVEGAPGTAGDRKSVV